MENEIEVDSAIATIIFRLSIVGCLPMDHPIFAKIDELKKLAKVGLKYQLTMPTKG